MAKKPLPTPEELRQLLRYEPETGKLFWLERTPDMFNEGKRPASVTCRQWNTAFAGKEALYCVGTNGYPHGTVNRQSLLTHRVLWAIYHGEWPTHEIDHIDGDPANNRIANLRAATSADNKKNRAMRSDNRTGATGITWHHRERKWRARIGQNISLGYFDTKEEAIAARREAERAHGYSSRHGR